MSTALLMISFQNDFFLNGRMPLEKSAEAAQRAQEILERYRSLKLPVIHIQHVSTRPDAIHFLPCTRGVDFYPSLRPQKNEAILKKHYPNSFRDTSLASYLKRKGIDHLVVAGMMTHLSVDATVRAACDLGLSCTVVADACATSNLEFAGNILPAQNVHQAFLAALEPLYARIVATDDLLANTGAAVGEVAITA